MHFLRSHLTLVASSAFLAGSVTLVALAAFRVVGLWAAAELFACGTLLAACAYLALILWRLTTRLRLVRDRIEEQTRELTEIAREDRDELFARTDDLLARMARAHTFLPSPAGDAGNGARPARRGRHERKPLPEPAADWPAPDVSRAPERSAAADPARVAS